MGNQPRSSTATLTLALQAAIQKSGKALSMIAMQAGFSATEEWTRTVDGHEQLPGNRIAAVAKALDMDVIVLARLTVAAYHPEFLELFDAIPLAMLSPSERRMVQKVREMTDSNDAEIIVADGRDLVAVVMV